MIGKPHLPPSFLDNAQNDVKIRQCGTDWCKVIGVHVRDGTVIMLHSQTYHHAASAFLSQDASHSGNDIARPAVGDQSTR
jgi:hypothetical protein